MKIFNTKVYGLNESIIRSGYPLAIGEPEYSKKRAMNLAGSKHCSGHDCFLKGIIVQFDLTAPSYFWPQFQRYHFAEIISSQSKMHNILKFNIEEQCNKYVTKESITQLKRFIEVYNSYDELSLEEKAYKINDILFGTCSNIDLEINDKQDIFQLILSNCPMGLNLTAGITTNYLQLKTIYFQRNHHRLIEWKIFCTWIKSLEMSEILIYDDKTS